jgi:hypothetical protein
MSSLRRPLFTGMCLALLGVVGCSKVESPTAPSLSSPSSSDPSVSEARAATVQLCHRTESGHYNLLSVNGNAEAAHRAHGDGKTGELVPGAPTHLFDRNCVPVNLPSLSVSSNSAAGGVPVTVTLTDGTGSASDWLAFAAAGAPDPAYLQRTLVGADITTRTWTVNMPTTAGTYEFRLFNGSYARLATSPSVTVTIAPTGPTLTLDVPSATAARGSVSVTLTNGPGGARDWLAFAPAGSGDTTFSNWTYVGAGVTTKTWTVTTPATSGSYEFRLFLNDGYTRAATSAPLTVTVAPPPAFSVNAGSARVGTTITVTLTDGLGGSTDWIAFAATGAANQTYVVWTYVGASVTTRTWTVTAPAATGTYEFRLFLNNGYTRAATSPPVTVIP